LDQAHGRGTQVALPPRRNAIDVKYSVIYFHNPATSTSITPFLFLRDSYKKLPIQYYALLDKIYAVGTNFLAKNAAKLFEFGRLFKLYSRRIVYLER
jgi:hypothetical protein